MRYEHLLGRKWEHGTADCYSLLREIYRDNWGLEMGDYARPKFWWHHNPELDLIRNNFQAEGFVSVDRALRRMLPGDGILMAVTGNIINHCGVYLGGGWMVHHPFRGLSEKALYAGHWLNQTMVVARHPDVKVTEVARQVDLMDLLPPAKRERYRALRESRTNPQ